MRKIESLHGVISVERRETPPTCVFVMGQDPRRERWERVDMTADGGTQVTIVKEIESYVRVSKLPVEMQEAIRAFVRRDVDVLAIRDGMHMDTLAELEDALKAQAHVEEKP
jgi:hypothetical protein